MTKTKKYAELQQLLQELTYEEIFILNEALKKELETDRVFPTNENLSAKINDFVEILTHDIVYDFVVKEIYEREDENAFNNIIGYCYEFMKFRMFSKFHLALAFYDYFDLTDKKIEELYKEVDYENIDYFEALETFKENKTAEDLMIFMRSFSEARKVNILEGFTQAKNFKNRYNVITTLIGEAGLEEERIDIPRYDHTFNEFMIKNITKKEEEVLYELNLNEEIIKISDFRRFGMTLIVV